MGFKEKQINIIKYTNLLIKIIIAILALLLIFNQYIVFSENYNFKIFNINYNLKYIANNFGTITTIEIILCITVIVMIKFITNIYIHILEQKYAKHYLYSIDNDAILHLNLKVEITEGNLRTEGCKRTKNRYMIELPKYKCTIKRFDEQELIGYVKIYDKQIHRINGYSATSLPDFKFFTKDSIIEYTFEMLDNENCYPFLYEILKEKFYDVSIIDKKIIIRYHLYNNSIDESKYERHNNFYNYDFTINTNNCKNDNIINVIEKAEIMYFEIIKQIGERNINGNKN